MVNPVLIVVAVIIALICLVGIIVFMVYMQHPDDKNTSYFSKIIVVRPLPPREILSIRMEGSGAGPRRQGVADADPSAAVVRAVLELRHGAIDSVRRCAAR